MRSTGWRGRVILWILLANLIVALLVSCAALVVLLIAPLGMAAVLSCTALVGMVSFAGGLVADVLLWLRMGRGVPASIPRADWGETDGRDGRDGSRSTLPGGPLRLPGNGPR